MLETICWALAEAVLLAKRLLRWHEDHAGIIILAVLLVVLAVFIIVLAICNAI
jgi:hypothetical protein